MSEFYRDERDGEFVWPPLKWWEKGGPGGDWRYGWLDGDDGGGGPTLPESPDKPPLSLPYLRTAKKRHFLLRGKDGRLLTGSLPCAPPPAVLFYVTGEDAHKHADCILVRITDPIKILMGYRRAPAAAAEQGVVAAGWFGRLCPGQFTLSAKWQAGHYEYAKYSRMGFRVFGVSLGSRVMPLKSWIDVAVIEITEDGAIWVNGIKGSKRGNESFYR